MAITPLLLFFRAITVRFGKDRQVPNAPAYRACKLKCLQASKAPGHPAGRSLFFKTVTFWFLACKVIIILPKTARYVCLGYLQPFHLPLPLSLFYLREVYTFMRSLPPYFDFLCFILGHLSSGPTPPQPSIEELPLTRWKGFRCSSWQLFLFENPGVGGLLHAFSQRRSLHFPWFWG